MADKYGFTYSVRIITGGKTLPVVVREVVDTFALRKEELQYGMIVKIEPVDENF